MIFIANKKYQIFIILLAMLILLVIAFPISSYASISCKGRFVNPISDICWKCLLPISIGGLEFGKGHAPSKRDTSNPTSPLCLCMKGKPPLPVPGVTLGFWEPARMVDITRIPYCMVGLGGIDVGPTQPISKSGSYSRSYGSKKSSHHSFYYVHYYIYPLIYWLELITDLICLEMTKFDVAYLAELDPTWNDDKLQTFFNPELFLFGNPIAQAACAVDCVAATVSTPLDSLFWCSGCWGNLYPISGANADHIGGVQNSSLLVTRVLAKMHRVGLAEVTSTKDNSINGDICKSHRSLVIKKSQYKLQMVYPKATSGAIGCWPIGMSDMLYAAFKDYPYDGQDWAYVIWRKRNCCVF